MMIRVMPTELPEGILQPWRMVAAETLLAVLPLIWAPLAELLEVVLLDAELLVVELVAVQLVAELPVVQLVADLLVEQLDAENSVMEVVV